MPLVIAACSSTKVAGTRAAFDKYVTRNHAVVRDFMYNGGYAAGWDWAILSADKGLLAPTTAVADYDVVLTPATLDAYVAKHGAAIRASVDSNDAADAVMFVGSKLYHTALVRALGRPVKHVVGANRGCGDHFSALVAGFDLYDEAA